MCWLLNGSHVSNAERLAAITVQDNLPVDTAPSDDHAVFLHHVNQMLHPERHVKEELQGADL
jgi:hypothetical protein